MAVRDRLHILVRRPATAEAYTSHTSGRGSPRPPAPIRAAHASRLIAEVRQAETSALARRAAAAQEIGVRPTSEGMLLTFESWPGFELELSALDPARQPPELIAVRERVQGTTTVQLATVHVPDDALGFFLKRLDALMTMALDAGASLRLIGDPAQHGAIAAGGMFRVLCEQHRAHTPELTTSHRVLDPSDRAAAQALRDGRIDDALDQLTAAGHLHVVGDDATMYRELLGRWWDAHRQGADHPMVDRRNHTRRQLNRLAHLLRRANGEIGDDELVASGDRPFSVGDRVTARSPNRALHPDDNRRAYVRNGSLGTVVELRPHPTERQHDALIVDFNNIGIIEVPRTFFDHHRTAEGRDEVGIDHAYALTSYAVQGSTRDVSTSRVDATTTRAETYVDITRGRHANHLYLTAASDPLDGEALPRLPGPPPDHAVAQRLERSTGELTAWELASLDQGPAIDQGQGIGR